MIKDRWIMRSMLKIYPMGTAPRTIHVSIMNTRMILSHFFVIFSWQRTFVIYALTEKENVIKLMTP